MAPYYILDQHTIVPEVFAVNKSVWNKLSSSEQKVVREAAVESATYQRKLWAEREKKSEKIVRDAGATIVELTDKSAFINAMKPVYTKIATDPEVKAILTKIQAVK